MRKTHRKIRRKRAEKKTEIEKTSGEERKREAQMPHSFTLWLLNLGKGRPHTGRDILRNWDEGKERKKKNKYNRRRCGRFLRSPLWLLREWRICWGRLRSMEINFHFQLSDFPLGVSPAPIPFSGFFFSVRTRKLAERALRVTAPPQMIIYSFGHF